MHGFSSCCGQTVQQADVAALLLDAYVFKGCLLNDLQAHPCQQALKLTARAICT
jgi:hypothetical protein